MFCSGFSVNGFALAASDGVTSLGIITGSSVCRVDLTLKHEWFYGKSGGYNRGEEIAAMTQAQTQAWRLALARLQEAARERKAHGVLDVRFARRQLGPNVEEITARGTAVLLDRPPLPPTPFVCSLSSQEFWTLRRGGYRPVGLALGACTRYCVPSVDRHFLRPRVPDRRPTREIMDFTRVVVAARDTALARLIEGVRSGLAEGVIGITMKERRKGYPLEADTTLLVSVTATGTAITPHRDRWSIIDYALPLND